MNNQDSRRIYLDNAATTLLKPRSVAMAMHRAVGALASPGRGGHRYSMRAADTAFNCRELAAELFNVRDPSCVVFTFNATHALNIAINSLAVTGTRVVVSGYEHNSVMRPLRAVGADIVIARGRPFDGDDVRDAFRSAIEAAHTDLVVTTHMSNVFGFVLPIDDIEELCRERGIPLIVDASQSAGSLPLDFAALGAEFVAMPGHKGLYGPQGTGLLLCRSHSAVRRPLISGGSGSDSLAEVMPDILPDGLEAGTHNMPGIAGLLEGLRFVKSRGTAAIHSHSVRLISAAARELSATSGVTVYGGVADSSVLSLALDGLGCEEVAERLDKRGIAVRAGLHCAPEAHRTAGTLEHGTVRISTSIFNTERDIATLVEAVKSLSRA